MSTLHKYLAVFAATALSIQSISAIDLYTPRPSSRAYVQADALILGIANPDDRVVAINENTGQALLTTDDSSLDFRVIPRITAGLAVGRGSAFEATYFGLNDWQGNASVLGNNNLSLPGDVALATLDFFNADRISTRYSAEVHNIEVNHRRRFSANVDQLFGIRYISFDESFDINSFDVGSGTSDYLVQTQNDLIGLQYGADGQFQLYKRLSIRGIAKAGVYYVDAAQQTLMGDFNNTILLRNFNTDEDGVAFVGEYGLNLNYWVSSNCSLVAGYNAIFIQNIARAPGQLDFTDFATSGGDLRQHSDAILHGANIGMVVNF